MQEVQKVQVPWHSICLGFWGSALLHPWHSAPSAGGPLGSAQLIPSDSFLVVGW